MEWRRGRVAHPVRLSPIFIPVRTVIPLPLINTVIARNSRLPLSFPHVIVDIERPMKTSDFDYALPTGLIAQTPIEPRDHSRLLVLNRQDGSIVHKHFYDIVEYLLPGDVMVFNNSRVIPARLKGKRAGSGGVVEVLLLRRLETNFWEALAKPARRLNIGAEVEIHTNDNPGPPIIACITALGNEGIRTIRFTDEERLLVAGEMPLPPYIHPPLENPERYQTVYSPATSRRSSSVKR